jgi:hypothetical protein
MWQKNYYATCHNFEPSLIIILDNEDQYHENKVNFMPKNLHSATC